MLKNECAKRYPAFFVEIEHFKNHCFHITEKISLEWKIQVPMNATCVRFFIIDTSVPLHIVYKAAIVYVKIQSTYFGISP